MPTPQENNISALRTDTPHPTAGVQGRFANNIIDSKLTLLLADLLYKLIDLVSFVSVALRFK